MVAPSSGEVAGRGLVLPALRASWGAPGALPAAFAHYLALTARAFGDLGAALPVALRPAHASAVEALRAALGTDRRAALAALASPAVGSALHCVPLRDGLPGMRGRIDEAAALASPALLLELAARGLLQREVEWPHPVARLASVSLGACLRPAVPSPLRFGPRSVRVGATLLSLEPAALAAASAGRGATGLAVELCHLPVGGLTRLALLDHNPISSFEAHPEKAGNSLDLGGRAPTEWQERLAAALSLVETHLPELRPELALLLHELVPVGFDAERHLSASYREAIGTVYLTLHPSPLTLSEALVHEFQHNKLNLASYAETFLENAFSPLYPSPVRPDPRPLWGILLAVHAFLPVTRFLRGLRDAGHPLAASRAFEARLAALDGKNREGLAMLRANGRFTPAGRELLDELSVLEAAHDVERGGAKLAQPDDAHEG